MSTMGFKKVDNSGRSYSIHYEIYDNVKELVNNCKTRSITNRCFKDMEKVGYSLSFDGVKNYEEALSLLENGYQPTVESMKDAFKNAITKESGRFKFENQIQGFVPIVPLALNGVPNCMLNMRMTKIKCKVIDVYYDMTCRYGIKSSDLIKAGQSLLGTIVELEKQGYRINLYTTMTYNDGYSCDMLMVKVKSATQPLDIKRISFSASHTAFFRVIGFDWYSKVPGGKYRDGYGRALFYDFGRNKGVQLMKKAFGENAVYISAADVIDNGKTAIEELVNTK